MRSLQREPFPLASGERLSSASPAGMPVIAAPLRLIGRSLKLRFARPAFSRQNTIVRELCANCAPRILRPSNPQFAGVIRARGFVEDPQRTALIVARQQVRQRLTCPRPRLIRARFTGTVMTNAGGASL